VRDLVGCSVVGPLGDARDCGEQLNPSSKGRVDYFVSQWSFDQQLLLPGKQQRRRQLSTFNSARASSASVQQRNPAAELRDFQVQLTGVAMGELTANSLFRHQNPLCRSLAMYENRSSQVTLSELRNTIQNVLDIISDEDF
jgi:hypothetical protein